MYILLTSCRVCVGGESLGCFLLHICGQGAARRAYFAKFVVVVRAEGDCEVCFGASLLGVRTERLWMVFC